MDARVSEDQGAALPALHHHPPDLLQVGATTPAFSLTRHQCRSDSAASTALFPIADVSPGSAGFLSALVTAVSSALTTGPIPEGAPDRNSRTDRDRGSRCDQGQG